MDSRPFFWSSKKNDRLTIKVEDFFLYKKTPRYYETLALGWWGIKKGDLQSIHEDSSIVHVLDDKYLHFDIGMKTCNHFHEFLVGKVRHICKKKI